MLYWNKLKIVCQIIPIRKKLYNIMFVDVSRSGIASYSIIMDGDSPFTTVSVNADDSLDLKPR